VKDLTYVKVGLTTATLPHPEEGGGAVTITATQYPVVVVGHGMPAYRIILGESATFKPQQISLLARLWRSIRGLPPLYRWVRFS